MSPRLTKPACLPSFGLRFAPRQRCRKAPGGVIPDTKPHGIWTKRALLSLTSLAVFLVPAIAVMWVTGMLPIAQVDR